MTAIALFFQIRRKYNGSLVDASIYSIYMWLLYNMQYCSTVNNNGKFLSFFSTLKKLLLN